MFFQQVVIPKAIEKRLRKLFSILPVPYLPDVCFKTVLNSSSRTDFKNMLKIMSAKTVKRHSNQKYLNPISHYNFITQRPCPIPDLMKYRDKFRSLLRIRKSHLLLANSKFTIALRNKNLKSNGTVFICVHVRRSDYLKYSENAKIVYPSEAYYKKAFKFYRQK